MTHMAVLICAVVAMGWVGALASSSAAAADVPSDRVVVMYFHRTQRCPTCLKMGSYSEEAVKNGFADAVKEKKVEFHYIDFQDEKNVPLAKAYHIEGPALVVVKVVDNKAKRVKNLTAIWTNVADKDKFVEYVQQNVTAMIE